MLFICIYIDMCTNYLFIWYSFFIFANLSLCNNELFFLIRGEFLPSISHLQFLPYIMPVKCMPHVCIILLPLCTKQRQRVETSVFRTYMSHTVSKSHCILRAFLRLNFRTHLEANGPSEFRGPPEHSSFLLPYELNVHCCDLWNVASTLALQ
jgi:hypothetical protein